MHNYELNHKALPPAAVRGPDGKPLLSWRVLLLPYIEEETLFKQFHLDEAWDSPHNIKLLDPMPGIYTPFRERDYPVGHTFYQVIVGPGTPFSQPTGMKLANLASQSLLIVEAAHPIPWTKPDDLCYDPNGPLPSLGGILRNGFARVAWVDGSVSEIPLDEPEQLRAGILGKGVPGRAE
jgi:hypothetical protein